MMDVRATSASPRQAGFPVARRRSKRRASPIDRGERPATRPFDPTAEASRMYSPLTASASPIPGNQVYPTSNSRQASHASPANSGSFRPPSSPVDNSAASAANGDQSSGPGGAAGDADPGHCPVPVQGQGQPGIRFFDNPVGPVGVHSSSYPTASDAGANLQTGPVTPASQGPTASVPSAGPSMPSSISQVGPLPGLQQQLGFHSGTGTTSSDPSNPSWGLAGHSSLPYSHYSSGPGYHHSPSWYGSGPHLGHPLAHPLALTSPHYEPYPSTVPANRGTATSSFGIADLFLRRRDPAPQQQLPGGALLLTAEIAPLASDSVVAVGGVAATPAQNPPGPGSGLRAPQHSFGPEYSTGTSYNRGSTTTTATAAAAAVPAATTGTLNAAGYVTATSPPLQGRFPLPPSSEIGGPAPHVQTRPTEPYASSGPNASNALAGISSLMKEPRTSEAENAAPSPAAFYYTPQYQDSSRPVESSSAPAVPPVRTLTLLPTHPRPQSPPTFPARAPSQSLLDHRRPDHNPAAPPHSSLSHPFSASCHRPQLPQLPPISAPDTTPETQASSTVYPPHPQYIAGANSHAQQSYVPALGYSAPSVSSHGDRQSGFHQSQSQQYNQQLPHDHHRQPLQQGQYQQSAYHGGSYQNQHQVQHRTQRQHQLQRPNLHHGPYQSHHQNQSQQQHPAMPGDSGVEPWMLQAPSAIVEEETHHPHPMTPEAAAAGYSFRSMPDGEAAAPATAAQGLDDQWEDAPMEQDIQETQAAARPATGSKGPGRGSKGRTKGRSAFTEEARQETGKTRKEGACVRCKMQRIRCVSSDPSNPNMPCDTCQKVSYTSKKTIHHIPCRRYKLMDAEFGRQGGLNLTRRWDGIKMKDVGDRVDDVSRFVEFKIFFSHDPRRPDLYDVPLRLQVSRFQPKDGDVLDRKWRTRDNRAMATQLTPFALTNVQAAAEVVAAYIDNHAFEAIIQATRDSLPIVKTTYRSAIRHFHSLDPASEERQFFVALFRLWFAMRLTTGSAYISGEDTLDMEPEMHPDYPLRGRVSLPRMITAQVDSILSTKFLRILTHRVVKYLEGFVKSNNPKHWFTIYIATFILLHEISHASMDRGRYARDNGLPTRFSLPHVVASLHHAANVILLHWHYFKSGIDPSTVRPDEAAKTPMSSLTDEQKGFVWEWWGYMTDPSLTRRLRPTDPREQAELWEDPLYFVMQMFTNKWEEMETFQG